MLRLTCSIRTYEAQNFFPLSVSSTNSYPYLKVHSQILKTTHETFLCTADIVMLIRHKTNLQGHRIIGLTQFLGWKQ